MTRFSAKELLKQSHKKLNKKIRLFCDDKEINLPDLQGVLVLNIPSYAAGINFWGDQSGGTVRRNCTYVRTCLNPF
jgi:diacylglycerol kinase (ATP)